MRLVSICLIVLFPYVACADYCDDFSNLVNQNSFKSVDDVLAGMSQPPWNLFLQNYLFMFKSQSLQPASMEFPRAILNDGFSSLIIAFAGKPAADGSDTMEIICWRNEKVAFEFYELAFDGAHPAKIDLAQPNPGKCLLCHGADPRPNWAAYNFWPGMYGAVDSMLYDWEPEFGPYQEFLSGNRKNGRYKYLIPYQSSVTAANHAIGTDSRFNGEDFINPLLDLNILRIARLIKSNKYFSRFEPALEGALIGCDGLEEFIPEAIRKLKPPPQNVREKVAEIAKLEYEKKIRISGYPDEVRPLAEDFVSGKTDGAAGLEYILSFMGMNFDRLTTGFDFGTYDSTSGGTTTDSYWSGYLHSEIFESSSYTSCEQFKADSLKRLKDYVVPEPSAPDVNLDPLTTAERAEAFATLRTTCLTCHGVTQAALPLGSESELQSALKNNPALFETLRKRILGVDLDGASQMPYLSPLPPAQEVKIIRYLHQLQNQ